MKHKGKIFPMRRAVCAVTALTVALSAMLVSFNPATAAELQLSSKLTRQVEKLDRGVVAVKVTGGVFISWRLLGYDPGGAMFNIYRDGTKITAEPVGLTNFTDPDGTLDSKYAIGLVTGGSETERSEAVSVWANQYLEIPLAPAPTSDMKVTAAQMAGKSANYYSLNPAPKEGDDVYYIPNDGTVADLDGDGQYEIIILWMPTNAKDSETRNYRSDRTYIDAYKLDGTHMWRIDLGPNISSGAHDSPFLAYDFNGDGKAEVAVRTSDGTVDGVGGVIGDANANWMNNDGKNLDGPLFLTVFEGVKGAALDTVPYDPQTSANGYKTAVERYSLPEGAPEQDTSPTGGSNYWGDNYGNRSNRFNATVAYLNGETPSMVFQRGYYAGKADSTPGRTTLAAYKLTEDNKIVQEWRFDTYDILEKKTDANNKPAIGNGNHQVTVGDVDGDGFDEIILGGACIDNDGTLKWSTGLGHGDAMHLGKYDPTREGYQLYIVHEESPFGQSYHDAATGGIIHRQTASGDTGRGLIGIFGDFGGYAFMRGSDATGTVNTEGTAVTVPNIGSNFRIYWDGDLWDEMYNDVSVTKAGAGTIFSASGSLSNNGSKRTPTVTADIIGDWREEFIVRSSDNTMLRLYMTVDPTEHSLYTFMHDPLYRLGVTWQNASYNQPPHISFYLSPAYPDLQPKANVYAAGITKTETPGDTSGETSGETPGVEPTPGVDTTPAPQAAPISDSNSSDDEGGIGDLIVPIVAGAAALGVVAVVAFVVLKKKK